MKISELLKLQPWYSVHYDANQKAFVCRSIETGREYFSFESAELAVMMALEHEPLNPKKNIVC